MTTRPSTGYSENSSLIRIATEPSTEWDPEASDNPSDNDIRRRSAERDVPRHRNPSNCGNPTQCDSIRRNRMHGKEKVYGSIP